VVEALLLSDHFNVTVSDGQVVLRLVTVIPRGERFCTVRERTRQLGLSNAVLSAAMRWARRGGSNSGRPRNEPDLVGSSFSPTLG
jgi:hypothetical protein